MEKDFVPYPLALRLKEIGFNEPCFGYYDGNHNFNYMFEGKPENFSYRKFPLGHSVGWISAPTFSQAFRWVREKYDLFTHIEKGENPKNFYPIIDNVSHKYNPKLWFDTYEEVELACLKQLIEIVEQKEK